MSSDLSESTAPSVSTPKPKADIYTAMLAVALFALLFGIGMLVWEMISFGWDAKGTDVKGRITQASSVASTAHWA